MVFTKVGSDLNTLHVTYYESAYHKEGFVDLTLLHPEDSSKIHTEDTVDIPGIQDHAPGEPVTVVVHHPDHSDDFIEAKYA